MYLINKNIKVEMLVDEKVFVFVDVNSIRTVLRNLLSNAIKFTNEGGVISIFADEWKDKLEIGIHDTGGGMRKEDQQKIFNVNTFRLYPSLFIKFTIYAKFSISY